MKLLGIDPGLSITGYAIIKKDGHQSTFVDYGYLQMSSKKSIAERVHIFHGFFTKKIKAHEISHVALETPFLGKNAQNFLKLGYLRGVLYLLTQEHNATMYEFSPREVKRSVTGYGGASKDQVARAIMHMAPNMQAQKKQDVTDAIAVALCGLWKNSQLY